MPGLAAAGFKPAVYTNFTTLADTRMILEERAVLEAMVNRAMQTCKQPRFTHLTKCARLPVEYRSTSNNSGQEKNEIKCHSYTGRRRCSRQACYRNRGKTGFLNPSKTKLWE